MYPWNNENLLQSLKVSGKNDILTFETKLEHVEAHIEQSNLSKVICHMHDGKAITITKDQSHHIVVGKGNTERDVYHFLKPGGPCPHLRLGITKHRGLSTWSSLPHPFELNCEHGFEEVFFYLLEGGPKRALQVGRGMWCDGSRVDNVWMVHDRSWCTIPMGYHPVVGEPEVAVSYIWAYLAKKKEWEKI